MSSGIETEPRGRALGLCVEATVAAGGRPLSLHDLARATGVSARMLVHHFGSKAGLDRAIIETVERRMRENAVGMLDKAGSLPDAATIMQLFQEPAQRSTRTLFRTLLARGLGGDDDAIAVLRSEREHWLALFRQAIGDEDRAAQLLALVLGATLEAIIADITEESHEAG